MTGDKNDVVRISRQILNRSIAHRTIPKQECMVELAKLPLTSCSENIETVNISGSYTIKSTPDNKLVDQYRKVAPHDHSLSFGGLRQRHQNDQQISWIPCVTHLVQVQGIKQTTLRIKLIVFYNTKIIFDRQFWE